MSADTTILIFNTLAKGSVKEYRVANVQTIDDLRNQADYPSKSRPLFNRSWVRKYFADQITFYSERSAMEFARELQQRQPSEHGIRIETFNVFFPASQKRIRAYYRRQKRKRKQSETLSTNFFTP